MALVDGNDTALVLRSFWAVFIFIALPKAPSEDVPDAVLGVMVAFVDGNDTADVVVDVEVIVDGKPAGWF